MPRKKSPPNRAFIFAIVLFLVILACGPSATPTPTPAPADESALRTSIAGTMYAEAGDPTSSSSDATAPPDATAVPSSTSPPDAPTNTPIVHTTQPGNPASLDYWMTDRSSAALAAERRANADNFSINLLERPFTSQVMDYQNYLDIVRAELDVEGGWVYANVYLEGSPPQDSTAQYGVEIDLNKDGRGDWLIIGTVPNASDWTTDGMTAWRDPNGDVGGASPMNADAPNPAWNGYDGLVFDLSQGIGADPDLAWIRRLPSNANVVQVAFKYTLISSASTFLWGVWSDEGAQQPGKLDYNDHFTLAQAGSPTSGSADYPLKDLASLDNSCRWAYNFTPVGNEPGLCYIPPTATPPPTPVPPGSISGRGFHDGNLDGIYNAGDYGVGGLTVWLRQGGCGSSVVATTATAASTGRFSFSSVSPGTYCVRVQVPGGNWDTTTNPRPGISVSGGANTNAGDFGFGYFGLFTFNFGLLNNFTEPTY